MKPITIIALLIIIHLTMQSQTVKIITVQIPEASPFDVIVTIDMKENDIFKSDKMSLQTINSGRKTAIPFQAEENTITWIIDGPVEKGTINYEISYEQNQNFPVAVSAIKKDGKLIIKAGSNDLLCYQYEMIYPPEGVDTAFKRNAFIHPLYTPYGQILTQIQAPDHYHHYGIWNPWTLVLFDGDTIDFWNLKKRLGTVRFAGFKNVTGGPVYAEYEALHEHVVFNDDKSEKIALNELQKVRVYRPDKDYYIVDMTMKYQCSSEIPFHIFEYRYAGLGWRATGEWNKDNSEVFTSEGKTRKDADGSMARWYVVQGKLGNDSGGIVMMSHISNYNHPEPIRIWPETANDRGDVYANFVPVKNKDWLMEPGKTYTLKYRLMVFNGKITPYKAENGWFYYARPDGLQ